jgi:hypothetical protein
MGRSWVDDNHYRDTSEDGKTSYLYEAGTFSDTPVEIAEHHSDGSTTAYEVGGILDSIFNGGKGDQK